MKTLISVLIIFSALQIAAAQSTFEGILEYSTYSKVTNDRAIIKWMVKDGNSRLDINGTMEGKNYGMMLLFRKGDKMMYVFDGEGETKSMFTLPQDSLDEAGELSMAKVAKADGKKIVGGFNCYLVRMESSAGITECWLSDEVMLTAESFPPSIRSIGVIGALRANGISGIPLDVVSKDANGEVSFSFTIKSITPKILDASLFTVPVGYQSGEELIKKSIEVK